jgi:hypothetical protein
MDIENSVPRSIAVRSHQPTKLDAFIAPTDIDEESPSIVLAEELEKSPTRSRMAGRLSEAAIVAALAVQPSEESADQSRNVIFKQPTLATAADVKLAALPVAPIALNTTSSARIAPARMPQLTPLQLGKCRPIDIPSSLEKFKSLKIGLDSLHQSPQLSEMASPYKNPFTPKTMPVPTGLSEARQDEHLKCLIEESLCVFKSALRNDIQDLHVELIKQSLAQQSAFAGMMEEYMPAVRDLMEEIRRLREENELLRLRLQL